MKEKLSIVHSRRKFQTNPKGRLGSMELREGWHLESEGHFVDANEEFLRYLKEAQDGDISGLGPDFREYVYLLIAGLFTNHYPQYMEANIAHLKRLSCDVRKVRINTDASVETNAETIRKEIEHTASFEKKKMVIIGHSKGGVDAAAAIAKYDLYEHIHAFCAIQVFFALFCPLVFLNFILKKKAPYAGTPFSSEAEDMKVTCLFLCLFDPLPKFRCFWFGFGCFFWLLMFKIRYGSDFWFCFD